MSTNADTCLTGAISLAAQPLNGAADDDDGLMDLIADARFVPLGEASHGTHEFHHERARITRRLIAEKGFTAVAAEADWPDAHRVNRYVRGLGNDRLGEQALAGFKRFPAWTWRNADVVAFIDWLRGFNQALPSSATDSGWSSCSTPSVRSMSRRATVKARYTK